MFVMSVVFSYTMWKFFIIFKLILKLNVFSRCLPSYVLFI